MYVQHWNPWRSKKPVGTGPSAAEARNSCSDLLLRFQSTQNNCSGLPWCRQSSEWTLGPALVPPQRSKCPLGLAPAIPESSRWAPGRNLCYAGSRIAPEVAFKITDRRISVQIHKTMFRDTLLRFGRVRICTR